MGAIQLLGKQHARKTMRQRELRQGQREVGAPPHGVGHAVRTADDETEIAPVRLPGRQACSKRGAVERSPAFVEQHDLLARLQLRQDQFALGFHGLA